MPVKQPFRYSALLLIVPLCSFIWHSSSLGASIVKNFIHELPQGKRADLE